jgi:hypothetical protein
MSITVSEVAALRTFNLKWQYISPVLESVITAVVIYLSITGPGTNGTYPSPWAFIVSVPRRCKSYLPELAVDIRRPTMPKMTITADWQPITNGPN